MSVVESRPSPAGPRPSRPRPQAVLTRAPPLEGTSGAAEFRVRVIAESASGLGGGPMSAAPLVGYSSSSSEDEDEAKAGAQARPGAGSCPR